mgnify:CR=1 FL=1
MLAGGSEMPQRVLEWSGLAFIITTLELSEACAGAPKGLSFALGAVLFALIGYKLF